MARGVPGLGETVTMNDQRTGAHLGNVHSNTVRLDISMLHFDHHGSLRKASSKGALHPSARAYFQTRSALAA